MGRRGLAVLLFLLILVPSAQFAWRNRDMPDFSDLHDDGLLFVSAKSLAQGQGYRIASLPERPYQTKYPPFYPWVLSWVWRVNPSFPANLVVCTFLCWLTLALCIGLSFVFYGQEPELKKYKWWMIALLGLCPYMAFFGARMFSEIAFTCLALATLLFLRRTGTAWVVAAGLMAAAAYMTRTAGMALIASSLILMASRKQWRNASIFAALTVPVVLGWNLWSRMHLPLVMDQNLMYYVDYMGFQKLNVGWDNITVVLWKNFDQILFGMGSLVLPKVFDSLPVKIIAQTISVAMIVGIVRLLKQGRCADYALFSLFSCAILVVWHFPPNERFVLPLFPLLLAGLFIEMEHLWRMLRGAFDRPKWGDRIVAAGFGGITASVLAVSIGLQFFMTFYIMQEISNQKRAKLAEHTKDYSWLRANLPQDASVFSFDDPLLYLYTGHTGSAKALLPRYWYAGVHPKPSDSAYDFSTFCQSHGLGYAYFTAEDAQRDDRIEDLPTRLGHDRHLIAVRQTDSATIFRVNMPSKNAELTVQPLRKAN